MHVYVCLYVCHACMFCVYIGMDVYLHVCIYGCMDGWALDGWMDGFFSLSLFLYSLYINPGGIAKNYCYYDQYCLAQALRLVPLLTL